MVRNASRDTEGRGFDSRSALCGTTGPGTGREGSDVLGGAGPIGNGTPEEQKGRRDAGVAIATEFLLACLIFLKFNL